MKKTFFEIEEARDFVKEISKDWTKVDSKVVLNIDEKIINQEHFTFKDTKYRMQYNISILEYYDFIEVHESSFRYNNLVLACENEDIETFNEELLKPQTQKSIILAFKYAIYNDNLEMVKTFVERNLITDETMRESPLRTATIKDSKNAFFYLIEIFTKESDLIAQILWNNAKVILEKINESESWKNIIFIEPYLSHHWVHYLLEKKSNETIDFYKNIIKYQND